MKKLILIAFVLVMYGCSKSDNASPFHIEVISSDASEKTMDVNDSHTPRITFTGTNYDGNFVYMKGTPIIISCGFTQAHSTFNVRIIVTKNGSVIADQSAVQRANIQIDSAP